MVSLDASTFAIVGLLPGGRHRDAVGGARDAAEAARRAAARGHAVDGDRGETIAVPGRPRSREHTPDEKNAKCRTDQTR